MITCETELLIEGGPAWFRERRRLAWEAYLGCPVPKAPEAWRFTHFGGVELEGLGVPELSDGASEGTALAIPGAPALSFVDGHFQEGGGLLGLPSGVEFGPLSRVLEEDAERLKPWLLRKSPTLGSEPYLNLHTAFCAEGAVLFIPKGTVVESPLVVTHQLVAKDAIVAPYLLVVAEEGAQASVVLVQRALPGSSGLYCSRVEVFAAAGAHIRMHSLQALGLQHTVFQWHNHNVGREAYIEAMDVHKGGQYSRFENQVYLGAPGAQATLRSLALARGTQVMDHRSFQHHQAPHTGSRLLYKNALWESSRTIFSGMITVAPQAQHTNAYQQNDNLLLSTTAEANALPGLEIEANEVACSHGATISQADPETLFYLRSRGLDVAQAKALMVDGFVQDLLLEGCASAEIRALLA